MRQRLSRSAPVELLRSAFTKCRTRLSRRRLREQSPLALPRLITSLEHSFQAYPLSAKMETLSPPLTDQENPSQSLKADSGNPRTGWTLARLGSLLKRYMARLHKSRTSSSSSPSSRVLRVLMLAYCKLVLWSRSLDSHVAASCLKIWQQLSALFSKWPHLRTT